VTARPKWYQSIFVHTLLLVMGVVVALVGTIAALILLRPPPLDPPLTAYELARVLSGRPIANHGSNLRVSRSAGPPPMVPSNPADELIRRRLAAYLGRPLEQVRFARRPLPSLALALWRKTTRRHQDPPDGRCARISTLLVRQSVQSGDIRIRPGGGSPA
jgi:hypothetical protein